MNDEKCIAYLENIRDMFELGKKNCAGEALAYQQKFIDALNYSINRIQGVDAIVNTLEVRTTGECKTCKHYKPILYRDIFGYSPRGDGSCDIRRMTQDGELEINVNDDFYCKYYERGDDDGKS